MVKGKVQYFAEVSEYKLKKEENCLFFLYCFEEDCFYYDARN